MSYRGAREACLETSRLYMRPTTSADGDGLYHVHRDAAVSLLLANVDQMSRSCSDHLLQGYVQHWRSFGCGFYLVFDRKEAASPPIGRCGLRITPTEEVELGYCFLAAATGRGVATEAAASNAARGFVRGGSEATEQGRGRQGGSSRESPQVGVNTSRANPWLESVTAGMSTLKKPTCRAPLAIECVACDNGDIGLAKDSA